jgi:hypothetical protein
MNILTPMNEWLFPVVSNDNDRNDRSDDSDGCDDQFSKETFD